jgi:hypothetical protein
MQSRDGRACRAALDVAAGTVQALNFRLDGHQSRNPAAQNSSTQPSWYLPSVNSALSLQLSPFFCPITKGSAPYYGSQFTTAIQCFWCF